MNSDSKKATVRSTQQFHLLTLSVHICPDFCLSAHHSWHSSLPPPSPPWMICWTLTLTGPGSKIERAGEWVHREVCPHYEAVVVLFLFFFCHDKTSHYLINALSSWARCKTCIIFFPTSSLSLLVGGLIDSLTLPVSSLLVCLYLDPSVRL
jgi:hypothetical protein